MSDSEGGDGVSRVEFGGSAPCFESEIFQNAETATQEVSVAVDDTRCYRAEALVLCSDFSKERCTELNLSLIHI